jgi:aspartyl-tRNA(Asn)/glutamyl-tRNA(Gln) amidotransferase subunit B
LFAYLNENNQENPVSASRLGSLIDLVESGQISGKIGKDVLQWMYTDPRDPQEIVKEKGLSQLSDESTLTTLCEQALKESQSELEKYRSGREGVFRHFVAKVMQYTKGKANPKRTAEILKEMIDKMPK